MSAVLETIKSVASPTNGKREIYYPETDGKPMGETEYHVTLIMELFQALRLFFADRADAYVAADLMFYYEEGNPKRVVAPDVMVVLDSHKLPMRRIYKLWEEATPSVMIEVTSNKTWKRDLNFKKRLYEKIGVSEYYIVDPMPPERRLKQLPAPFLAYRLSSETGRYRRRKVRDNRIFSPALELELVLTDKGLRLFNPAANEFLSTMLELAAKAKAKEAVEAENAELKARLAELEDLLKKQN